MDRAGRIAIGKLSKETGTNIDTIRYYERVGLLTAPTRTQVAVTRSSYCCPRAPARRSVPHRSSTLHSSATA